MKNLDITQPELNFIDTYEKEKEAFIRTIGIVADSDIKKVVKGPGGVWRIDGMTSDEWTEHLRNEYN